MLSPKEHTNNIINVAPAEDKINSGKNIFFNKTDLEIWRAFKEGNEVAFAHIYNHYFSVLYRYGSQYSRDRNFIKDSIQDLFMELLRKRTRLSDTNSIKYYLFKSLKITIISRLKRQKIDYHQQVEGFDFGISLSVEEKIINSQLDEEKKQKIANALAGLKKKQREIIYYYFFEEMDLQQISSLMSFSNPKSAQNLLYRTLHLLKESLQTIIFLLTTKIILANYLYS